jgi:hypothetical protein
MNEIEKKDGNKKIGEWLYLLCFLLIMISTSCNLFTKDKDEEEQNKRRLEYKLEREIVETKNFNYLSELISVEKEINLDTVKVVLKEYYKTYRYYNFNEKLNRLEENDDYDYKEEELNLFDFVNRIEKQNNINRKKTFLITNQVELFFKLEKLEELEIIKYELEDINSRFSKD